MSKFLHENSKSKRGITLSKNLGLPPLLVWVHLIILNNCSEFQVNIFSNNRDIGNVKVFVRRHRRRRRRRRRQGYDNTSTFSSKTAMLKNIGRIIVLVLCTWFDDSLHYTKFREKILKEPNFSAKKKKQTMMCKEKERLLYLFFAESSPL